jgi:hypothetical protein
MVESDDRIACCAQCRYWEYEVIADGPRKGEVLAEASCLRYPPAMVVIEGRAEGYSPQTHCVDWCGEFRWWSVDPQAKRG